MKAAIFLSASIPYRKTDLYVPDPLAIREAILAVVAVTVPHRQLVFGGHPAISPLVEHAARSLNAADNVHVFQSRWFEKEIPPEAQRFHNFHWTNRGSDEDESLLIMRQKMLNFEPYCAAVLIGGMDGVENECLMFKMLCPGQLVLPVASTRGAAELLWKAGEGPADPTIRSALAHEHRYRGLFRRLLP
jgi:hypothetical protein